MKLGVKLYLQTVLSTIENDCVQLTHTISGDSLYRTLQPALEAGALQSLRILGDAEAPNTIAQAVLSGHLAAREFEEEPVEGTPFKVERITV